MHSLLDFFIKDTEKIENIKNELKNYNGKKMAIAIYLLQSKFKLIALFPNSKTQSRTRFNRLITSNENISTQSIDKVFFPNTEIIMVSEKDLQYIEIEKKLKQLGLSTVV